MVIALAALVATGSSLGATILVVWRFNEEIRDARASVRVVADLVAIQSSRTLQALELVRKNVDDYIGNAGPRTADNLRVLAASNDTYEHLRMLEATIGPLQGVMIVDAAGDIVAISKARLPPSRRKDNVSDRQYFKALKDDRHERMHIGAPLKNRYDGSWMIPISYRINSSSGEFIGIIICAVPLDYFEQDFRNIMFSPDSAVRLYRSDGALLASSVREEAKQTHAPPHIASASAPPFAANAVALVPEHPLPPDTHIAAVSAVTGAPLFAKVSVSRHRVLALWRSEALTSGIIALVLDVSVALAGLLAVRQMRASARLAEAEGRAARHDVLTDLPNRAFFQEEIGRACLPAKRTGTPFALLLLDVDRFKEINDTLGHRAGDELLRKIGRRLSRQIETGAFLARLGGDEFAVIQPGIMGPEQVREFGQRLLQELRKPLHLQDNVIEPSVSIGAALAPADGADPDTLFDNADLALYQAKAAGRGMLCRFSEEIRAAEMAKLSFVEDLHAAVENQRFAVFFQPIVDLRTRRIAGFEALLRWNDPDRGAVAPARFIPVAEETGLIGPLGAWVLREACRHAVTWPGDAYVAVNLSPVQLRISDVYEQVRAALENSALAARRLEVEITETVQLTADGAGGVLHRLRDLGVGVSLDDFGTGYASLSYLRSFPFDRIKIDRSFVQDMDSSDESAAIVRTVVDLARRLGITVTGEGIETLAQLESLRRIGCTKGQGYLIGRPMPASEVQMFLQTWAYPCSTEDASSRPQERGAKQDALCAFGQERP